jgi:hypothetical protein
VADPIHIGVTATQRGASPAQLWWLRGQFALAKRRYGHVTLHHGDCVGGDAEAHELALEFGFDIEIHPPQNPDKRAFCGIGEERTVIHPTKGYHGRNFDIVHDSQALLGMPEGHQSSYPRSGSWATLRVAIKQSKPIRYCLPNGEVGP